MKVAILLAKSQNNYPNFTKVLQVCKTIFTKVELLTENGQKPQFDQEEEIEALEYADYKSIDLIQNDFNGLVIPEGSGHYYHSKDIKPFIYSFVKFKKPICFLGTGCGALLATAPDLDETWMFAEYSLTAPSNLDLLKTNSYDKYPSLEEFIFLNFGQYSASVRSKIYIVVGKMTLIATRTCNLYQILRRPTHHKHLNNIYIHS